MSFFKHTHPYLCTVPSALCVALDLPHETEWEHHTTEHLRGGYSKKNPKDAASRIVQKCSFKTPDFSFS